MLSRPADLDEADLAALLASAWGITVTSLEYRPVGFGSHHWQAGTDWFVTVDEPGPDHNSVGELSAALGTAQDLSTGGLAFVVAPIATRDGAPLARRQRFAVAVYPYVEGRSFDWDAWSAGEDDASEDDASEDDASEDDASEDDASEDDASDDDAGQSEHRRAVLDLIIALHTTTIPTRARHVDLSIPHRLVLTTADDRERGPYSRRTAALLARHRTDIQRRLAEYDELTRVRPSTVVITHGEPHPGNTMLTAGGWRLIDWDTVRLAPPERDLWSLPDLDRYADATGYRPDPRLIELFRRRWDLADLAVTAERFRHPHTGDADDDRSWEILEELVG